MLRLIILAVIGYAAYRIAKRWIRGRGVSEHNDTTREGHSDDVMVKDPQCGTYFPRRDGVPLKSGKTDIVFCCAECRDKYVAANPPTEK